MVLRIFCQGKWKNGVPIVIIFFLQNLGKSGFPLNFGSFEYLCRTMLVPWVISYSIVRLLSTVRLSMSNDILFMEAEKMECVCFLC